jgi:alpha-1,2-mannosyltransferase
LLASPHVLDYDLTVLAPAIAFIVASSRAHGFRDYDISLLSAAWLAPLLTRALAGEIGLPVGLITMLTLYAVILRRAIRDRAEATIGSPRIAQA